VKGGRGKERSRKTRVKRKNPRGNDGAQLLGEKRFKKTGQPCTKNLITVGRGGLREKRTRLESTCQKNLKKKLGGNVPGGTTFCLLKRRGGKMAKRTGCLPRPRILRQKKQWASSGGEVKCARVEREVGGGVSLWNWGKNIRNDGFDRKAILAVVPKRGFTQKGRKKKT